MKVMNKIPLVKLSFGLVLLVMFSSFIGKDKNTCDRQKLLELAVPRLKKYTLMQDYPFSFKKKKKSNEAEMSKNVVTLNRGVRYRIYTIKNDAFDGQPIVTIYNNEKLEFMIATTYNASRKVFYNEIEFECKTTGNYCLCFSFLDGEEGCALGIISTNITE